MCLHEGYGIPNSPVNISGILIKVLDLTVWLDVCEGFRSAFPVQCRVLKLPTSRELMKFGEIELNKVHCLWTHGKGIVSM